MSFLHPALLGGLAIAALPILIHLLLRPRPRRVRFPALALMRSVLATGQRANRIQNVLLMLLRATLLAGAAVLLAGPTCIPTGAATGSGPVACVLILDDSVSTDYRPRFDGADTLLDASRRQAEQVLESSLTWPPDSALAVLRAGDAEAGAELTESRAALVQNLREDGRRVAHALPLGDALQQAVRLLRAATQPQRRIVVCTDGAASAWRNVRPGLRAELEDVSLQVITPPNETRANLGLVAATAPSGVWPANVTVPLQVIVANAGVESECWLVAYDGADVLLRQGPLQLHADVQQPVTLELPPGRVGPRGVTVALEPEDLLETDQHRYVTWQTGRRQTAWLVLPAGTELRDNVAGLVYRNLLAPELLPDDQQRLHVRVLHATEVEQWAAAESATDGERPRLVVVFSHVSISDAAVDALVAAVERGAVLVLAPLAGEKGCDWPGLRALFSEASPVLEELTDATAMRPPQGGAAPDQHWQELAQCGVWRRLRLSALRTEANALARYRDNEPSLLVRRIGRGQAILMTTSPDPEWSDLGVRASGLMSLLHTLVDESLGPATLAARFTTGEESGHVLAGLPPTGLVHVSGPNETAAWIRLTEGRPQEPWPTAAPGLYRVRAPGTSGTVAWYAVNWPAEELDLTPVTRDGLVRMLGIEEVELKQGAAVDGGTETSWIQRLLAFSDPSWPLGVFLLVVFAGETLLATRPQQLRGAK